MQLQRSMRGSWYVVELKLSNKHRQLADNSTAMSQQATCKRFHEYCKEHSIQLEAKGFRLSYDTHIPRQAGLSGSSAIVCAGGPQ